MRVAGVRFFFLDHFAGPHDLLLLSHSSLNNLNIFFLQGKRSVFWISVRNNNKQQSVTIQEIQNNVSHILLIYFNEILVIYYLEVLLIVLPISL